jgi:8-oxo-dGTP pyrophosphatase MutT (NUDIX family)
MPRRVQGEPIIAVGAVAYRITETRCEVLIIKKTGGYWTLPKGGVLADEPDEVALRRELFEEVGLTGTVEAAIETVEYITPRRDPPRPKRTTYYLVRADTGVLVLSSEEAIVGGRWVSFNGALKRIRRARIRDVVRTARTMLEGRCEGDDP